MILIMCVIPIQIIRPGITQQILSQFTRPEINTKISGMDRKASAAQALKLTLKQL